MTTTRNLLLGHTAVKNASKAILDSAKAEAASRISAAEYAAAESDLQALAMIQEWSSTTTDDLDHGESLGDRLRAMLVAAVDVNHDGEVSEDEQELLDYVLSTSADFLTEMGADETDVQALLEDFDDGAAWRVRDLLNDNFAADDIDLDSFVFGDESAVFDAAYKKMTAVRHGKKVIINKRISGVVKLSAKQKLAIKKAQMRSSSPVAKLSRRKSMAVRKRLGL